MSTPPYPDPRNRQSSQRRRILPELRDRPLGRVDENNPITTPDAWLQRPATANTPHPVQHRALDPLNVSAGPIPIHDGCSGYSIPEPLERRQSAPIQIQKYQAPAGIVPALRMIQLSAAESQWHRSSSPAPRKLGDTNFKYKDLKHNEIRILRILNDASSNIHCEVLHTALDNPQPYIALSYAWGDLEDTRCIDLEGHEFPVTESLWLALDRLRSHTSAIAVWADAICINQNDTAERNSQVQSMTNIYKQAKELAVWIGPEAEDSDLAVKLLHTLVSINRSPAEIQETIQSPQWRPSFRGLVALFARPYWRRLWVVQEVVNSSNITVHCGFSVLPWRTYATASQILNHHKPDLIRAFMNFSYSEGLEGNYPWETFLCHRGPEGLRNLEFPSFGSAAMLQALLYHRSKLCSDPKDRIYGILGILSPIERSQFTVDYNISTIEVYTNVVQYILNTTRRLDVICASIHYPKHPMMERLPSWVPDWSYYPSIGPLHRRNNGFCASGQSDAVFSFSHRRRVLSIVAIPIDTVKDFGTQLGVPINKSAILMAFFQWRLELTRLKGFDDLSAHESFCRTISVDQDHSDHRWTAREWMVWTYHSLATLLQERHPDLELDQQLKFYATSSMPISAGLREQTFSDYISGSMPGRRFAITETGLLCLGSGCLQGGDIVCVPLGCSTPILLRKHGDGYLFVGDVYVDGYMYGRAMEELVSGERQRERFVLH